MSLQRLYQPEERATADPYIIDIGAAELGWSWTSLRVVRVAPGQQLTVTSGASELFVLPLAGSVELRITDHADQGPVTMSLRGRRSVFTAVTDFAYVGRDATITLTSPGGAEVALPASRCTTARPAAYGAADQVPIEVRGTGSSTRQVNNFGVPGAWDHAEKLICCELLTPPGNWSSYPPHKHDLSEPCPVVNEEIYYYRLAGADQLTPSREGFGYHRTYTGPEHLDAGLDAIDALMEVRDNDVVAVPYGYHGPCIAAPGYPMYYLNIMAGPADDRSLAFCDDPAHTWVRRSWATDAPDPRCPMTSALAEGAP
jgi:5-deoxy-glucuronate isomerase